MMDFSLDWFLQLVTLFKQAKTSINKKPIELNQWVFYLIQKNKFIEIFYSHPLDIHNERYSIYQDPQMHLD